MEDTQIKDGHYKPGEMLEDGKWRVEIDFLGRSRCLQYRSYRCREGNLK